MLDEAGITDQSRVLAELLDAALADNWTETGPTMALLWQSSADPDDLRLAVKDLEQPVEDELALLNPDWTYLAVAHSAITPAATARTVRRTRPRTGPNHGRHRPVFPVRRVAPSQRRHSVVRGCRTPPDEAASGPALVRIGGLSC